MFPPSTVLIVYGIITETDIGKLFMAGIVPGLVAMAMYVGTIAVVGATGLVTLPSGTCAPRGGNADRWRCARCGRRSLLFVFVIGGLYGGLFTPTEAGGTGAGGAFLIGVARRRLPRAALLAGVCCRRPGPRRPCSRC